MIKIISITGAFATIVVLLSCSGNDFPENDKSIIPVNSTVDKLPPASEDSTVVPVNIDLASPMPATTSAAGAAPKVAGLNPAHGEPGHRCDISVGAPLNSPATSLNAQPAAPVSIPAPVTNAKANGSARVNPPHGEPGHDCSIAVGAPLNKD